MNNSKLDERQEQMLLKIEHNGFWMAFWGLIAVMLIEMIVVGPDIRVTGGEVLVLLMISVYTSVACLKAGIWDRKKEASTKTNLIYSVITALVLGLVTCISLKLRFPDSGAGWLAAGLVTGVFTFVLCFIALSISKRSYEKRIRQMEEEPEEGEEEI